MDHQRTAAQPRGQSARAGHEAAQSDDHCRADGVRTMASAWNSARSNWNGAASRVSRPLPRNPPTRQPFDWKTFARHDTRFKAATGAQPDDIARVRTQQPRQRQRRKHMAAGSAGHDEHGTRAHFDTLADPRTETLAS